MFPDEEGVLTLTALEQITVCKMSTHRRSFSKTQTLCRKLRHLVSGSLSSPQACVGEVVLSVQGGQVVAVVPEEVHWLIWVFSLQKPAVH